MAFLNDAHRQDLLKSGLTPETIEASRIYSAPEAETRAILGFGVGAGMVIPYPKWAGRQTEFMRVKMDKKGPDGKRGYRTAKGAGNHLYVAANFDQTILTDPAKPLYITEGEKKALKACQEGFPTLALPGVWSWKQRARPGDKTSPSITIPDFDFIAWEDRLVIVVFDSDAAENDSVMAAERGMAADLRRRGATVKCVRLPEGADGEKVGLDDYLVSHAPADLQALIEEAEVIGEDEEPRPSQDDDADKPTQAEILIGIAEAEYIFRSTDGETALATVTVGDHAETWPIKGTGFRRWLRARFYAEHGKPPGAQAFKDALDTIEAKAQFGGNRVHEVAVRVAEHEGAIYIDLANDSWEAVEVTRAGWRIVPVPPVKFRRTRGMLPLPRPVEGGSLQELRGYLNVRDEEQFALVLAWLVAAARAKGPYPVLVLGGEHGTAKSTMASVLRRLIDPSSAMLRAEPRDTRDVMIAATNGWVIALDNLSGLAPWLSDCLCRLATGGGFTTRELYSDSDETIFDAQRPVVLNGIEEIATRPDLLDRSLLVDLPVIADERRRTAGQFWSEFHEALPRLLGALLDTVSAALRREPEVHLDRLPRMADFAVWATAAAPALGIEPERFLAAYNGNRNQAHEIAIEGSIVGPAIRALIEAGPWTGTATDLLDVLGRRVDEAARRSKAWPANGRQLSGTLRRLAANLRAIGVEMEFERAPRTGRRLISLRDGRRASVTTVTTVTTRKNSGLPGDAEGDAGQVVTLTRSAVTLGVTLDESRKPAPTLDGDGGDAGDGAVPISSGALPDDSEVPF